MAPSFEAAVDEKSTKRFPAWLAPLLTLCLRVFEPDLIIRVLPEWMMCFSVALSELRLLNSFACSCSEATGVGGLRIGTYDYLTQLTAERCLLSDLLPLSFLECFFKLSFDPLSPLSFCLESWFAGDMLVIER